MRILLLNQFFWPDLSATSLLATDLARHMAAQGHDVTVICGRSSYTHQDLRNDSAPARVNIKRINNLQFSHGVAARIFSYASFFTVALWKAMQVQKPDVVVTLTTPPLLSSVGTIVKRFRGSQHFIWEMDVYPDVAVSLKVLHPRSWLTQTIGQVADYHRHTADGVIALGECMKERLVAHGISANKIHIAENWADGKLIYPRVRHDKNHLEIIYAGNLGLAHDISTIAAVMNRRKDDDRLRFVFVGGGSNFSNLQHWCAAGRISNASFSPYRTVAQLAADNLATADIGLVTQNADCVGSIVPSKVYALMAAGLPILFIGRSDATPGRIIDRYQCGWQVNVGEIDRFVALLDELGSNRELVAAAGRCARETFLEHYDLPHGVSRICDILRVAQPAFTCQ